MRCRIGRPPNPTEITRKKKLQDRLRMLQMRFFFFFFGLPLLIRYNVEFVI